MIGGDGTVTDDQPLKSRAFDVVDAVEANELFQASGWTDGLPIVAPTETDVRRFLQAVALAPDDIVGDRKSVV